MDYTDRQVLWVTIAQIVAGSTSKAEANAR